MKLIIVVIGLILSSCAYPEEDMPCLESANSQYEINKCSNVTLSQSDKELARVYNKIINLYKNDAEFLDKLNISQEIWLQSRAADLELQYPLEDKQRNYGSLYQTCALNFTDQHTLARIEFLKKWVAGHNGEVCTGSIMHQYCIENDCSKIRQ